MTVILLFEEFVSAQLHQYVRKSNCRGVLGAVHLVRVLLCFVLTQLSHVIQSHKLTCSTDRERDAEEKGLKWVADACERTVAFHKDVILDTVLKALTKSCVELSRSKESIAFSVQTLKHCLQLFRGQWQLHL